MSEQRFTLNSREEVIQILLAAYASNRAFAPIQHLSLVKAYDHSKKRDDGGNIFSVLLDICINFQLLHCDLVSANKGNLEGGSVLDSEDKFFEKMDAHRFNSSFIFRYRALWDKLMGSLILICVPDEYEKFVSAKSRRRAFRIICTEFKVLPNEFVSHFENVIQDFDDTFRTSEAHGSGTLRKWSFLMKPAIETQLDQLIGYWNDINRVMVVIGELFDDLERI